MKITKNLKRLQELKKCPFFSKPYAESTEADKKDRTEYYATEEKVEKAAAKLKKGDKVIFNFPDKVKNKNKDSFFSHSYIDHFYEGVISQPLKVSKRTRMGEDCSIETIKVSAGKYIYPVSPNDVEKL